ncbi:vesicle transport through interaction with t-SNAREs homolog 1A isoform X4 [Lutra lutra]|uniref:vesicle transport through interaction with t-SNAREs homolog 1A isoform X4 n=1 Tax=Lutra lutra TaxID=9657 RepID=UPI001FD50833|nr:vesicle transport through interaction with t-SNAREs homolog 1A isoform X4 [Lutra lutra]
MSSDFEGYEQDFAVLTAEITSKIARVPRLPPDEKKQMVANVEKQLEEAKELLEQMDLEVREIPPQSRGMYSNRMRSYKQEMGKLETDFRAHLLDNTERLERSSRRLEAGYQIAVETEQIGQEMLENLSHDREKIQRARERLRETDANLGKSSRVLTGMLRRWHRVASCFLTPGIHSQVACGRSSQQTEPDLCEGNEASTLLILRIIQNRILVVVLAIILVVTILMAVTFSVRRH